MRRTRRSASYARAGLLALPVLLAVASGAAGQEAGASPAVRIFGPPPPVPPAVINRDAAGIATIRAVRVTERVRVDGVLDEAFYGTIPAITGFIQILPNWGTEATEDTEAWVTFDAAHVYISARLWDSAPESEWIANELRRDTNQLRQNDTFGLSLDTFYDRRNGVIFYTNPLGAQADFAVTNEGSANSDWNPIWEVRTGRFEGGWTVEMAIPFKSLRYRPGTEQVWGIQLRRAIRRKNEWVAISPVSRAGAGNGPPIINRISEAATLVGIEAPPPTRNLEVKPYAISGMTGERTPSAAELTNDVYADAGLDLKYSITQNLTADLTYNTDFAQVEVDEQQVNLSRFNLQFPEKRDFFLEGRGIFGFAAGGQGGGMGGGNAPTLFFSRRIGLEGGEPIPILGGARLTGKVGSFDVGALTVQTDPDDVAEVPSTNFSVFRLRRDLLRRSNVGVLFTERSKSLAAYGSNQTLGVDGTFAFFNNVYLIGYYAATRTPGLEERDDSYQARFNWDADQVGFQVEHLLVGENFNPQVGFLRREGFRQNFVSGRLSPRPESIDWIRQVFLEVSHSHLTNQAAGFVESRETLAQFRTELENSDLFAVSASNTYERLVQPFRIAPDVIVPPGDYRFREGQIGYTFGFQRPYSGNLSLQYGEFYGGTRTSVGFSRGRIEVRRELSLEPSLSFNWVDFPEGRTRVGLRTHARRRFSTHIAATRVNYSFTPRMFLSGLLQYSTSNDIFSSNLRLRWEYAPGSEIFVVYTSEHDTDVPDRAYQISNRGLVIKVTRLLRP